MEDDEFGLDLINHNMNAVNPDDFGTGKNRAARETGYLSPEDKKILNNKISELMEWFRASQKRCPDGRELISFQCLLRTHQE